MRRYKILNTNTCIDELTYVHKDINKLEIKKKKKKILFHTPPIPLLYTIQNTQKYTKPQLYHNFLITESETKGFALTERRHEIESLTVRTKAKRTNQNEGKWCTLAAL